MIDLSARPAGKRVQLMLTCLCDAFFDDVGRATVEVLEHLGVQVDFPSGQTCCGQPAFNAGDWAASRSVVEHTAKTFSGEAPVVVPSGSCAAMLFHGAPLAFEQQPQPQRQIIDQLAGRTWEICDYIVNGLGITQWPGRFPHRIAFHRSCHSRGTDSGPAAMQLLESIEGLTVVPFGEAEQCCGFGGAFSVSFPNISAKMGQLKLEHIEAVHPEMLVSGDMGCLLHLGGLVDRERAQGGSSGPAGRPALPRLHAVQVLRDALRSTLS